MDAKTLRETNQLLQDFIHALTLEGVHHTIIHAAVTRTLNGSSPPPTTRLHDLLKARCAKVGKAPTNPTPKNPQK